jgi:3-hydroxyisobutyrate dehydrogenase-like beta-hydroxyacid dehydrogenase
MKIGFIGLGRMGQGIAGRVLGAGHELLVYNRTPEKAAALVQAGATTATSVAAACAGREVVITMLADDRALEQIAYGDAALLKSLPKGAIHMAMGTHSVDFIRALTAAHTQAGQILVSAPVLGRPDMAAVGQVAVVAGGPASALESCRVLFDVIGRRTFIAGEEPVSAAAIKITNNFVLGCAIEVIGEAYSLVRKYGVTPDAMYEVLTEGLFGAPAYKVYGKIIAEQAYDKVGVTASLGLKDANLALAAAGAAGVPLPSANVLRDRLLGAIAHGDGERDWAVIAREQARASGLE